VSGLRVLIVLMVATCMVACERSEKVAPEVRATVGDSKVVLLSASWCGYCKRARTDFRAWGVHFREYDVETSDAGRRAYALIGERFVPILLIGERQLYGYSPATVRKMLDEAGALPSTAPALPSSLSVSP
jgi:glutaredoxin